MMSFPKRSVHSFLGLTTTSSMDDSPPPPSKCHSLGCSLGLTTATSVGDVHRSLNVVESSTIKSTTIATTLTPPNNIGLFGDIIGGGDVDGLMSCTESLGFESSDQIDTSDQIDDDDQIELSLNSISSLSHSNNHNNNRYGRKIEERREVKKYPPLLSSLDLNGNPSFFLRPVRKDGRLELSEVRIDRPETLRAHREDGRLKLHLIRNNDEDCFIENEIIEEEDEEIIEEDNIPFPEPSPPPSDEEEEIDNFDQGWRRMLVSGGRCHEMLSSNHHVHHHHHYNHHNNFQVWSQQQYVASR